MGDKNTAPGLNAILNPTTATGGTMKAKMKKAPTVPTSSCSSCKCQSGGACLCCVDPTPHHTLRTKTTPAPNGIPRTGNNSTENLAELFEAKTTVGENGLVAPLVPNPLVLGTSRTSSTGRLTPAAHHHPSHTSPHVHKTKLYSPYDAKHNHGSKSGNTSDISRRSSLVRGHCSSEQQRSKTALTVQRMPTIRDPKGADTNLNMHLIVFPTDRPLVLSGCTCSDDCACPGCTIHDNKKPILDLSGAVSSSHGHSDGCGGNCNSCFDCRSRVELSPGIQTAEELRQIAMREVPLHQSPLPDFMQILPEPEVPLLDDDSGCSCGQGSCKCGSGCCGSSGGGGGGAGSLAPVAMLSGYGSDSGLRFDSNSVRSVSSHAIQKKAIQGRHGLSGKPAPRPILPRPLSSNDKTPPLSLIHKSNGHEHPVTIPHTLGASRSSAKQSHCGSSLQPSHPITPPDVVEQHAIFGDQKYPAIFSHSDHIGRNGFHAPPQAVNNASAFPTAPSTTTTTTYTTTSTTYSDLEDTVDEWLHHDFPSEPEQSPPSGDSSNTLDPLVPPELTVPSSMDPGFLSQQMSPHLLQSMLQQYLNEGLPTSATPPPHPSPLEEPLSPTTQAVLQSVQDQQEAWVWNGNGASSSSSSWR